MKLLIVEDQRKITESLRRGFEQQSFVVDTAYDSDGGLEYALNEKYDVIILDRMLGGSTDGIGILQAMRAKSIDTPVLILTAKDKILDKAYGLNMGADDYLVKPFAFVELLARVRALVRRPKNFASDVLVAGDLTMDTVKMTVMFKDKNINLSAKEFVLLEYFMRYPGRIISKDELVSRVWSYDADILPNTVEVYVGYLRQKIDKPFGNDFIKTRRGFGYIFGGSNV